MVFPHFPLKISGDLGAFRLHPCEYRHLNDSVDDVNGPFVQPRGGTGAQHGVVHLVIGLETRELPDLGMMLTCL
jgi:hypothetical protein